MGDNISNLNDANNKECFFRQLDTEFLIHEMKDPLAVIETGVRTLLERQNKYGPNQPSGKNLKPNS